jgi:hypothetical protein
VTMFRRGATRVRDQHLLITVSIRLAPSQLRRLPFQIGMCDTVHSRVYGIGEKYGRVEHGDGVGEED